MIDGVDYEVEDENELWKDLRTELEIPRESLGWLFSQLVYLGVNRAL